MNKILVIGRTSIKGVDQLLWTGRSVPNLADYDIVLIDSQPILDTLRVAAAAGDITRKTALEHALARLRERLQALLLSGGVAHVILHPRGVITLPEGSEGGVDNAFWLPFPVSLELEEGETVRDVRDEFQRYFALVRRWRYSFRESGIPEIGELALAKNRAGQALGIRQEYSTGRVSGYLFLLPPPTEATNDVAMDVLLEDCCGLLSLSALPGWAAAIKLPGDDQRDDAIERHKEVLARAQEQYAKAVTEREQSDEFRRLLYEKGMPLQEIVQRTFEEMEIRTQPSPVSDEFMLVDGEDVLVEVTGHDNKGIAGRDLSQLLKDLSNFLAEQERDVKGLLVGNGWANLPLEQRDTGDKTTFPDNVVKTATNRNIAILSTVELFKAYCAFLDSKIDGAAVMQRIREAAGVVILVP